MAKSDSKFIIGLMRKRIEELERALRWEQRTVQGWVEANNGLREDKRALVDQVTFLRGELATLRAKDGVDPAEYTWLTEGKIPLIKRVRDETGLGLKESKDIVDGWQDAGIFTADGLMGSLRWTIEGTASSNLIAVLDPEQQQDEEETTD